MKKKKKAKKTGWKAFSAYASEFSNVLFGSAPEFPTLPRDGIEWEVTPSPERVYAIGDIHGDLESLALILRQVELINDSGEWTGKQMHLVLLGDLIGGNKDSRLLLNFVMRLEQEAKAAGGKVHALLGNHDILPVQGNLKKFSKAERKQFEEVPVPGAAEKTAEAAFRGNSVYAKWVRERNAILKIGDSLFVHAGLDKWALEAEPARINATIRAWIAHWQAAGIEPPKATRWTVGKPGMRRGSRFETGPLWIRSYNVKAYKEDKTQFPGPALEVVDEILSRYQVKRIVVGHSPTPDDIVLNHPYYGERVLMLDTRLSDGEEGQLSAVEISAFGIQEHYVKRSEKASAIRRHEKQAHKAALNASESRIKTLIKQIVRRCGF